VVTGMSKTYTITVGEADYFRLVAMVANESADYWQRLCWRTVDLPDIAVTYLGELAELRKLLRLARVPAKTKRHHKRCAADRPLVDDGMATA
jgi:hypothetical protein